VIAAGRAWDEAKNIAAICGVARRLPWPVYVAGSAKAPDGQARDLPDVHLLGHLAAADLEQWFRRAAIYALPARYEPFGLSALEAALAGCALVLGNIPSLRELWRDAALFVEPDDHDTLAHTLQRLIADAELRHTIARRCRTRAFAFGPGTMAADYLRAYESVLGAAGTWMEESRCAS
jgi:glycogen synthase